MTELQNLPIEGIEALLPWESDEAYAKLKAALIDEHQPAGPTQSALIDRLADIIWKRQRIRLAERSLHLSSLRSSLGSSSGRAIGYVALATVDVSRPSADDNSAITTIAPDDQAHAAYYSEEMADLEKAIAILEADSTSAALDAALACLREDTTEWWDSHCEEEETEPNDTAANLLCFLKDKVVPEVWKLARGVDQRPAIRLQAWGESMNPIRLARLVALDGELDRQYERNLGMLLKLKAMPGEK
ncbi:MAG: hypothetical protein K0U61_04695 [Alphaproteobacteria bacterium]|nr:hypothetical protein [Alphaproteobacteria bacterium]